MLAALASCLQLDYRAGALAEMTANEVVIVDFAEKAYTLTVTAECIGHTRLDGYATHLGLRQISDGKHQVTELAV